VSRSPKFDIFNREKFFWQVRYLLNKTR